ADDQPVPPRGAEVVTVKGEKVRKVSFLLTPGEVRKLLSQDVPLDAPALDGHTDDPGSKSKHLFLVWVPEDQSGSVPRDRPMFRPSEWSLVVGRSYLRDACRKYGADSAELVRYHREVVRPEFVYYPDASVLPPDSFVEMVTHLGDLKRNLEEGS